MTMIPATMNRPSMPMSRSRTMVSVASVFRDGASRMMYAIFTRSPLTEPGITMLKNIPTSVRRRALRKVR